MNQEKTCAQLKASARNCLLGHYKVAIAALLIAELIALLLNTPFSRMTQQGAVYMVISRMILGYIGSLVVSLISNLFETGVTRIHLQIARKQPTFTAEILYPFKNHPDRFLGYGALNIILVTACELPGMIFLAAAFMFSQSNMMQTILYAIIGCILAIIGCVILIVIELSWALTTYLMLDNPNLGVMDAIRESRRQMRGNKGRLFKLGISFIGWILFSILSLGLALLWILPYITQTTTWFYLDVIGEASNAADCP